MFDNRQVYFRYAKKQRTWINYVNMNHVQSIREFDFFCRYHDEYSEEKEQKQEGKIFYFQGISLAVWISDSEAATAFASQTKQVMNYGSILPPE